MGGESEEFLMRMGFNADAVSRGTVDMENRQRKAAENYVGFWKKAEVDREKIETESAVRQATRNNQASKLWRERSAERMAAMQAEAKLQEKLQAESLAETIAIEREKNRVSIDMARGAAAEKAAIQRTWMEEQAAQISISKGSGAFGSLESTVEKGAESAAGGGHGGHGGAGGIIRESLVLMREASMGNWRRMAGSASILATRLASLGVVALRVTGIFGALVAVGATVYEAARARQAAGQEKESQQNLRSTDAILKGSLPDTIGDFASKGIITNADRDRLRGILGSSPDNERIRAVQRYLIKAQTKWQGQQDANASSISADDKSAEKSQKEIDELTKKERTLQDIQKDMSDRGALILKYQQEMNGLDKNSVQYHHDKAKLLALQADQLRDQLDVTHEQTAAEKEAADAKKSFDEFSNRAARDYMRNIIHKASEESVYPTVGNLAGRRFTSRLNRMYGRGGAYDLGAGNGSLAGVAQDYLLAQKQQEWDRTFGNLGQAEQDRQRAVRDRNYLIRSGAADPAMLIGKIGEDTGRLRQLFEEFKSQGMPITDPPNSQ